MQRRTIGTLCIALVGLAALIGEVPRLVRAQQLPPAQKIPRSAPLAGTKWMLAESAGQRVAQQGRQPYFELKALERYEDGSAGQLEDATDSCGNRLTGVYRTTGDWLHLRIISSTLLACKVTEGMPRGLGAAVTGDQRFRIRGAELDLLDNSGAVRARFIATSGVY
jgi:heat shock protein HslJ